MWSYQDQTTMNNSRCMRRGDCENLLFDKSDNNTNNKYIEAIAPKINLFFLYKIGK